MYSTFKPVGSEENLGINRIHFVKQYFFIKLQYRGDLTNKLGVAMFNKMLNYFELDQMRYPYCGSFEQYIR